MKVLRSLTYKNITIEIVQDDITLQDTDVIVNAANSQLQHGGGVAGAIVRRGGFIIQKESNDYVSKYGPVKTGEVAVTSAGNLKAKYVIHAVGPVWGEGKEDEKLRNAVINSLRIAENLQVESISIPAISSGIFGFPKDRCARVFFEAIKHFIDNHQSERLKRIRLCNIDELTSEIFLKTSFEYFKKESER
ncbi:MAG: O-acetyl-ADP-ribose deacetylase [Thermotogaceae bacterium]|jgi:putative ATPase|nr:O-acetyl-ADP-ribose deacetylase [Thermotogaceae bacterium]MDN5338038.1 O-acetyl-ADP-ribose deacetylase [Thermotogaceae bacterium]